MVHHANGSDHCASCELKLRDAHPRLVEWFRLIKANHPDAHLSWTFRDEASQEQAVREGKSKLHFPKSAHNAMRDGKPCARAMDLFQLDQAGKAQFQRPWYVALAKELESRCAPLIWGGHWKSLGDLDHLELDSTVL